MSKQFLSALGQNVKNRRLQKQWTQLELCYAAGVDLSYISRIERGQVNVSIEALLKVSIALDCDARDLLPENSVVDADNTEK
ncbi:helix-turn-helix transcriptional regulator [Rheinheimera sp. FR7-31]|uniref:helix-turn-helix domain-containing protein n=1 Tax=Rheinheimera fenheensis TaxID=3152295 RepID=UPI00325E0676